MRLLLLPAPGKRGGGDHFVTPAGDTVAYAIQPVLSIFLCQLWYVFSPVLKFIPFCGGVIWLLPERASFYSNRACLRVTQELIFSPVPFNSHQNTNVPLQRTKKWLASQPGDAKKMWFIAFARTVYTLSAFLSVLMRLFDSCQQRERWWSRGDTGDEGGDATCRKKHASIPQAAADLSFFLSWGPFQKVGLVETLSPLTLK